MEIVRNAIYALEPTLNIFSGALFPFCISSMLIALVAASLSRLDEHLTTAASDRSRFASVVYLIKLVHALPLIVAPAVSAGLLVYFLQDFMGLPLSLLQTPWALAFIGFIQHVFIAYLLLEHVFGLSYRRIQAHRHLANLPREWRLRRAALVLYAVAPPLVFVFGLSILLQHAMLAAPTFLTAKDVIVDARIFFERQGPALGVRVVAAICLLFAMALGLILTYLLGTAVSRLFITLSARLRLPRALRSPRVAPPALRAPLVIVTISALVETAVAAAVVFMLVDRLWRERQQLVFDEAVGLLKATLLSSGVLAAMTATTIVWVMSVWYRSSKPALYHPHRLMMASAIIAFTPSSVFASIALPVLTVETQAPLLWCLLGIWSASIAAFMFFHTIAESAHPELVNLRLIKASPARFAAGVLLGDFGSLAPSALVVIYILWIEDGIQATIRPQDVTVTSLLYRSPDGRWSPTSLLGIALGFLFWTAALIVVRVLTKHRATMANWIIDSGIPMTRRIVFVVVAILLVCAIPCAAQDTAASTQSISLRYTARGKVINEQLPAASDTLRVSDMIVDNDMSVELAVPVNVRIITIERLHYTSAKLPLLRFTGKQDQILEQLSIRSIQYDAMSREEAVLQLSGLFVDDLQVSGGSCNGSGPPNVNEPRLSIEMSENSTVRRAFLTCLYASSIELAVATRRSDPNLAAAITIVQVNLVSAHVRGVTLPGEAQQRPGGTIEINATMLSTPARGTPQVTIESFDWRGGLIALDPAHDEQFVVLNLLRLDRTGPTSTHIGLSKFPRAELRWEYGQLDGDTAVEAGTFQNLVLDHLRRGSGMNLSKLTVSANSYGGVALANVDVDQFEIKASSKGHSEWAIKTVQGVSVDEKIAIPRAFLESVLRQKLSRLQARHFVTTVRDYGQYSDDNALVGLDAVYRRKILDLEDISPAAAKVLDTFTGLGIRLSKPVLTWIIYTLAYITLSTIMVRRKASDLPTGLLPAWGKSFGSVLLSMFADAEFNVESASARTALVIGRNAYRFCFVLQLTILSIYLGQTALD